MRPFAIERYFARFEHVSRHLLLADSETLALWDDLSLGYTESPGLPLLRREIAGLYEGIAADDVLEVVPEGRAAFPEGLAALGAWLSDNRL